MQGVSIINVCDRVMLSNSNGSNRVVYQGCYKVILGNSDIK